MTIVPIGQNERRLPQAGRIRIGVKDSSRQGRKAINTFRFTSQDRNHLDAVAATYGGDVRAWKDEKSPDAWEVITAASKISVVLPPNPLSEWFEKWSGRTGNERRCDGLTCELTIEGPEGKDRTEVPCICSRLGTLECKYRLRLSVLLPEVKTLGTWRLDTSSRYARDEIPGMVEVIEAAQGHGLHWATLRLEQRTTPGHRFNVPVLDIDHTIEELQAGATRLASLPQADDPRSLGTGLDDEIVEAEIVSDPITGDHPINGSLVDEWAGALTKHQQNKVLSRAHRLGSTATTFEKIERTVLDQIMAEGHLPESPHDD